MAEELFIKMVTSRTHYSTEDAVNESITVGELIDILNRYDEDAKIVFWNDNGYTKGTISSYNVKEGYYTPECDEEEEDE